MIMKSKIKDLKNAKRYCDNLKNFHIYDYLYYLGITHIKKNISRKDMIELIEICNKVCSDYCDPITLSESLTEAVYENKYISLEKLKNVPANDIYDLFFEDKLYRLRNYSNNSKAYEIKIGFDETTCKKDGNIITGNGTVYYYDTKEAYNSAQESSISDFSFKYDIDGEKVFDVKCNYDDAKRCVENNVDDFINNLKYNLLPNLEEEIEVEMN